jgi:drug/metabolite transporter (DMT)-like permease
MSPIIAIWINWVFTSTFPLCTAFAVRSFHPVILAWATATLGFVYFSPNKEIKVRDFFAPALRGPLFMMGFFGSALPIVLLSTAMQYTTPANAAILAQIEVVYSLIMSRMFLKEKITPVKLLGGGLVISGTLLIAFRDRFSPRWHGDLMVLCAPWMYQLSHVYAKKLPAGLKPGFIAAARGFYAGASLLPWVVIIALMHHSDFALPPVSAIATVLGMGLVLNGFNMEMWYVAIRGMELSHASVIILSYPVMTFILSALLGVEHIHLYQACGLGCALVGAYISTVAAGGSAEGVLDAAS